MSSPRVPSENETQRWTLHGSELNTPGMQWPPVVSGPWLDAKESIEVVPAGALREAEERADRLEAEVERLRKGPAPSATAETSSPEPKSERDGSERCGWPIAAHEGAVCIREAGHTGRCQHDLMAALERSLTSLRTPAEGAVSEPGSGLDGSQRMNERCSKQNPCEQPCFGAIQGCPYVVVDDRQKDVSYLAAREVRSLHRQWEAAAESAAEWEAAARGHMDEVERLSRRLAETTSAMDVAATLLEDVGTTDYVNEPTAVAMAKAAIDLRSGLDGSGR